MKRAVVLLVVLAACGHSAPRYNTADLLTCTTLNAAVGATPGLERWERDEILDYAHHAHSPVLRSATSVTAVAEACDALHMAPKDLDKS